MGHAVSAVRPLVAVPDGRMDRDEMVGLERELVERIWRAVDGVAPLIQRLDDAGSELGVLYAEYLEQLDRRRRLYAMLPVVARTAQGPC
jgi:hypothetical protein